MGFQVFIFLVCLLPLAYAQSQCPNVGEKNQNPVLVTTTVTTITDLNTGMSRSFQSVFPGTGENIFNPSFSGGSGLGGEGQGGWGSSGMHGMSGEYPSGSYPSGSGSYPSGSGGFGSGFGSGFRSGFGSGFGPGYGGMEGGDRFGPSSWMRPFPYGTRRPAGTGQGYRTMMEGLGIPGVLNESDVRLLNASWNILKRRPDFAPKVFIRYFKMKPEAQRYFSEIANVPINDLPNNRDFLFRVYTCFNSLNLIIPHLTAAFPENYPAFVNLKNKYNAIDLKRFGSIFMTAMQEELGNDFTPEVREAWKKSIMAISNYASQPDQSGNVSPGQQPSQPVQPQTQ